jgi:hypothetical protein
MPYRASDLEWKQKKNSARQQGCFVIRRAQRAGKCAFKFLDSDVIIYRLLRIWIYIDTSHDKYTYAAERVWVGAAHASVSGGAPCGPVAMILLMCRPFDVVPIITKNAKAR